jgi:hypothetical protein
MLTLGELRAVVEQLAEQRFEDNLPVVIAVHAGNGGYRLVEIDGPRFLAAAQIAGREEPRLRIPSMPITIDILAGIDRHRPERASGA